MSVQGVFNTRVTKVSSVWVSNGWVHFTGLCVCILFWIFTDRYNISKLFKVENKYYLLGGVLGSFIVYTVIKGISGLGPCLATMIILIVQVSSACLIEMFGLFGTDKVGFEMNKIIGVGIMIAGIIIFQYK